MDEYVGKICPYCKTEIKEGEEVKVCPECGIPHHAACWEENKGCTSCGCSEQCGETQCSSPANICPNCGAQVSNDQFFCVKCGAKTNYDMVNNSAKSDSEENETEEKKSGFIQYARVFLKKRFKVIAVTIGAVAILLAMALYVVPQFIIPQINLSHAKSAFESGDYARALDYYEKSGLQSEEENTKQYTYCEGVVAYNNGDYTTAIEKLLLVESDIGLASDLLPQVYYDYGKSLFNEKEYTKALGQFKSAGDYSDAKTYVTACDLMKAEDLMNSGHFNEAKLAFENLPQDFRFNNIAVADRVNSFNSLSDFGAMSGKWSATDNYIESRNVYRRTGSWDNWYMDQLASDQTIEVYCYLNSDNTVTIKGKVSFYRFTNYSSISAYCQAKETTKSFTISNVSSIPSNYSIDSDTTLNYSGGQFSISYSVRDDYSSYFYNLYNSSVTYGNKNATY